MSLFKIRSVMAKKKSLLQNVVSSGVVFVIEYEYLWISLEGFC